MGLKNLAPPSKTLCLIIVLCLSDFFFLEVVFLIVLCDTINCNNIVGHQLHKGMEDCKLSPLITVKQTFNQTKIYFVLYVVYIIMKNARKLTMQISNNLPDKRLHSGNMTSTVQKSYLSCNILGNTTQQPNTMA